MVNSTISLKKFINKRINIVTKNYDRINGRLLAYDKFMNLILSDVEEYAKDKKNSQEIKRVLGLMVLRGSEIIYLFS